jgi:hypothetical protein
MRPLAAHALLPVISSRMDQERVRAALGADLQGLGAPLCEGTGIVSAVDAGADPPVWCGLLAAARRRQVVVRTCSHGARAARLRTAR